jgi:hypothetical protein
MWPGWGVGKGKRTRGFGDGDGPEGKVREQLDIHAHEKGLGAAATENIGLRSHSDNGVAAPEAERKRLLRTHCDGRAGLVQLRRRAAGDKYGDKERLEHFVRVGADRRVCYWELRWVGLSVISSGQHSTTAFFWTCLLESAKRPLVRCWLVSLLAASLAY